jgi:hypothetical protein
MIMSKDKKISLKKKKIIGTNKTMKRKENIGKGNIGNENIGNENIQYNNHEKNLEFFNDKKIMLNGSSKERLNEKFIGILGELEVIMMKQGKPLSFSVIKQPNQVIY